MTAHCNEVLIVYEMNQLIDWHKSPLSVDTCIDAHFRVTQNLRRFFARQLGHSAPLGREFMDWMRGSTGITLGAAVAEYKKQKGLK